jgi:hypothetical protein
MHAFNREEPPGSPIPPAEEDNLLLTFAEAMELADEGEVAAGYDLLFGGFCRAEDLRTEGEPWGDALSRRYRLALDRFRQQYVADPE